LQAAIAAHPIVEERLILLFCHLGERLGRVTPDGVALPLALTQRGIAQCVGALRPTVTTGLRRLCERGHLDRPAPRSWVITAEGAAYAVSLCARAVTAS
jgi:CRP/FNR family cyclic AMP-dependent transcriptional regulator